MHPVVVFDLISLLASVTALILLLKGWKRALKRDSKFLLLGLLAFITFYDFCLVLEWSGITRALDATEDFIGALVPMWWAFVFYAFLQEIASRDLRQSQERLQRVIQNMPVMMDAYDEHRLIIAWNRECERVTGYSASEMIGNPKAMELLYPDPAYRKRMMAEWTKRRSDYRNQELKMTSKDGTVKTVAWSSISKQFPIPGWDMWSSGMDITGLKRAEEALRESANQLQVAYDQATAYAQDLKEEIAERKRVENALRESETKYSILVENSLIGIYIDQEEKIMFANKRFAEIYGYPLDEVLGIESSRLVHPEDRDLTDEIRAKRLDGEEAPSEYEARGIRKDGTTIWIKRRNTRIEYEGKAAVLGNIADITESKRLEAQFQQAQKMEAIGTLAGGIAHDFNNLLMGIQGRASLMLMDARSDHPYFAHLSGIEDMVKRGADLSKRLLGFARGGKYEVRATDLNLLIEKSAEMFGRTKKETKIHRKYQKEIWPVEVDQGQIEQVLLNLYVNSWQAMPEGGDLYLETKNMTLDKKHTRPFDLEPGKYVKISVTDTGVGMDETTRQRVFEPFFTTREMGGGTGLGLASAYGIIKNHGGMINVYSEPDHGTTIDMYLPASEKEVTIDQEPPVDVLRGTETVLLVDDEDMILEVGKEMLTALGYKVMLARSGNQAVELYKENEDKIDMVVLDMIMPGMGGAEVYDKMKESNPNIKALLSSGYSMDGRANEILRRGCDGFIQKPFNVKELSSKLREILDKE